jgi:hypothetical protein
MDLAQSRALPMEPLFAELPPPGARPVEVTVMVPDGGRRRCVMDIVVAEDSAGQAFAMAFAAVRGVEGFEVTARRFEG